MAGSKSELVIVWPLMMTIGFGVAGRAGVVDGVGDAGGGCAVGWGCGDATGLRFVVGLRFVWPIAIDDNASKRIRGKGLSFIPELMGLDNLWVYGPDY